MKPLLYRFVLAKLRDVPKEFPSKRAYWRSVAAGSGVSVKTIEKVARLQTESPTPGTLEPLAEYFDYTPHKAAALMRRQARQPALVAA